jgi:Glycosyltransferase family 87
MTTSEGSGTNAGVGRLGAVPRLGILVLCLISFGLSARQTVWYFAHNPVYSDFRIFLTGIAIVKSGHAHELYRFPVQQAMQQQLFPSTRLTGILPFNHLAFELLLYWPLFGLPYQVGMAVWALINLIVVLCIAWLLGPYTKAISELTGIPIAVYLLAFYPIIYVLGEAQDSLIFLLLIVASLRSMDRGRTFVAGVLLALGGFKLHLALLMAFFVLFLPRKWRGVAGFATGSIVTVGISFLIVGPNLFVDYITMLRKQETMTPWGFNTFFMPNLRGLSRWLFTRWLDPGQLVPVVFMASVIVTVIATWIVVRAKTPRNSALLYSVAVLTTILISYHLHVQDLSMAILPMLLIVDWAVRHPITTSRYLPVWTTALSLSIAGLYLYRIAAEPFLILLFRSCCLALPILLLWVVGFRAFCESRSNMLLADSGS